MSGVTGLLWADAAMFVQVLEGPRDAIASVMHRLRLDPRHVDMEVLLDHRIEEKEFGAWAMAMPGPDVAADDPAVRFQALFGASPIPVAKNGNDTPELAQKSGANPSIDPTP